MPMAAVDISNSIQQGLDAFFAFLPKLVGFLLILLIGYVIARVVKGVLQKVLDKVGIDRALHSGSTGSYVNRVAPDVRPSRLIGSLAFWFLFLGAVAIAVSQLGIAALDNFVAAIGAYIPNIVAAVLIFVIAGVVAAAIGGLVARTMGDTPTGKVVGSVVPVLVMAIATFMILNQLQIAPEIVTITYAALIGGVFLAMALAFGLGGREVAGQMLSDAYDKGQENKGQVKDDMRTGKERGKRDAERAKTEAQARTGNGAPEATTSGSATPGSARTASPPAG
jgi:Conserved TM helix